MDESPKILDIELLRSATDGTLDVVQNVENMIWKMPINKNGRTADYATNSLNRFPLRIFLVVYFSVKSL